jgi:hypothetical protein
MTTGENNPRWLDATQDAPPGFDALVRADESLAFDAERLTRVADGLSAALSRPELGSAIQAELLAPATASVMPLAGKLLIGLAVLGAAGWLGLRAAAPEQPVAPASLPAAAAPEPLAVEPPEPASAVVLPAEEVGERAPARVAGPRRVERASAGTAADDPAAELALLERAQRALQGEPRAALALAREHGRRFVRGQFVQEREMIAIEAMLQLGNRAAAEQRGKRFLRDHPASSHTPRLRQLLAGGTR